MRNSRIFLYIFTMLIFLTTCKENKVGPDPKDPQLPAKLTILEPSAVSTYWSDQEVACLHDAPKYNAQTEWKANGEAVACNDGQLSTELPAGTHSITATISAGGESVTTTVDITVKEGFSVALDKPMADSKFFVGDKLTCSATVTPDIYQDDLVIRVNGEEDCTAGSLELTQLGDATVVATVSVAGRTEADEATVSVIPVVAGTIYPLTDQGVTSQAIGFTITLTADGERFTATTSTDGRFRFSDAPLDIYERESITIEVAATGDFYGAKAILPDSEWDIDVGDHFVPAGRFLREIIAADSLGFVLAPRSWQIHDGELAGNSTNLKLKAAFTRYDPDDLNSSFYKLRKDFGKYKYSSIFSEKIPIPTAFNRAESAVAITASDSTDFWQQTDEVTEPYVGRGNLFAPAAIAEVPSIEDGIRVQFLKYGEKSSATYLGDINTGYIVGGWMRLAIHNLGSYGQTHEQIHNLAFGHTSEWAGIMSIGSFPANPGDPSPFELSVNDVAHIQVYIDTFDLQFTEGISFGVLEWMQALDIKGLPETTSSAQKTSGKRLASYTYEMIECRIH